MSKEVLTNSERYVRKTNRIILIVGVISFVTFLFGLFLLFSNDDNLDDYQEPVFTDDADAINMGNNTNPLMENIEFDGISDKEEPITTTPNPVHMGAVVLGTEAKNVLTVGTNGKGSIRIVSVKLAEPPFDGFTYNDGCTSAELRGNQTCNITMNWAPVISGNAQNNFIISWHETNVSAQNAKAQKVSFDGKAVTKEECGFCDVPGSTSATDSRRPIYDENGNIIGYVGADGTA